MFRKTIFTILLAWSATGCVGTQTPLQKDLDAETTPQFAGYISPITVPIKLRYKPIEVDFKGKISMSTSITENRSTKNENTYFELIGKQNIQKLGSSLIRNFTLTEIIVDGKSLAVNFTTQELMDTLGNVQETEIDSSGFNFSDEALKMIDEIQNTKTLVLPEEPLQVGDRLNVETLNVMDVMSALVPGISGMVNSRFEFTVKGLSFFNGRDVVVVSVDETTSGKIEGIDIQIRFIGYQLYDVETAQILEARVSAVLVMDSLQGDSFSIKLLGHGRSMF